MAQTYTLEEAAQRLGVTPEVLKRRLKEDWKTLRVFRDGATLRFRTSDVDELARALGEASDPSLQLAPLDFLEQPPSSSEFEIQSGSSRPSSSSAKGSAADEPLIFDVSDIEISLDEEPPGKASARGDSDVRLDESSSRAGKSPESDAATEEVEIDLAGPGSAIIREGSAAKLTAPRSSTRLSASDSNRNITNPQLGESSEFELSLEADSDDFELQINQDSSDDEVIIGDLGPKKPGESGINLRDPKDSDVNLERKGPISGRIGPASSLRIGQPPTPPPPQDDESDQDFELSLDVDEPSSPVASRSGRLPPVTESDSEFELNLDDESQSSTDSLMDVAIEPSAEKNDIFETDFEVPSLDSESESESESASGSEIEVLDSDSQAETSDFDLALDASDIEVEDESASQVVVLDDEEAEAKPSKSGRQRRPVVDEESVEDVEIEPEDVEVEEEEEDASAALAGVPSRGRFDEEEEEEDEEEPTRPVAAAPAPWGVLPLIFLAPAFLIMIVGSLVGFEMLQSMWGYHQPRPPSAPIVRGLAEMLDMDVKDQ